MAKYHVGKDGQARPCKAASPDSCPLAKADGSGVVKHFDSLDAAQSYGERVAMGLVGEGTLAPGMYYGHYMDDSGHVYPKAGQEWSDDDRAAYVQRAIRETLVLYEDDPAFDDLKSIAAGEWDWDDMRRECMALTGYGQSKGVDSWWDALDSKCPVIDVDGVLREDKDSERSATDDEFRERVREAKASEVPATDDEISAYVFAANRETLQHDVSVVPSFDGMEDSLRFKGAIAEEKALIRESLDRADAAVASGDFRVARDKYQVAAEHLGFDYDPYSFKRDPVLKRLLDRWNMASRSISYWKDMLSMEYLPNDPSYDEVRQLKPGTFSITEDGVIPLDKDSERSATEGKVERVRSANANVLQHDVSIVSSFDRINDSPRFDAATAEDKALIRESLDRADAAVASGDFEAAADEYQVAAEHLGYDHGTDSFQPYDPVLDRLKDRWSLAYSASHAYSDKEHQLEAGSYSLADGEYVVPFYRRGDDDEDGIRR